MAGKDGCVIHIFLSSFRQKGEPSRWASAYAGVTNKQNLPKRAILVVNAKSRQGADAFEEACRLLSEAGIKLIEAHAVKNPKQMGTKVKAAIAKAPMVIIGGGDGTLSETVDYFLGSDTVFAILPLGTANSFARTMAI